MAHSDTPTRIARARIDTRSHHIRVPVTERERLLLVALAAGDGVPVSTCIRGLIDRELERRGMR